jgi:hypothetical protein
LQRAGLVEAEDERRLPQRLAQQLEPLGPQVLDRPARLGQQVVQGLRIRLDGLP